MAVTEGGLAHDKELVTLAKAGLIECQEEIAIAERFEVARATLNQTPDDPSANLAVGQLVVAIGSPLGFQQTSTHLLVRNM